MLTASKAQPATAASSPAFGFVHLNKGGGTTQKLLINGLSKAKRWEQFRAGTADSYMRFWNKTDAARFRILWGHQTLGQIPHTGRPGLYWTSLRDPANRTISMFNQACACGVHKGVAHAFRPCNATLEEYIRVEALSTLSSLLGLRLLGLRQGPLTACAAAGDAELRAALMDVLFGLATTQLSQPCFSTLLLSRIEADVAALNSRWRALGFALPTSVPQANKAQRGGKEGTAECDDPRLIDANSAAVQARAAAAATTDPFGAWAARLFRWSEAHAERLWARPLALCDLASARQ